MKKWFLVTGFILIFATPHFGFASDDEKTLIEKIQQDIDELGKKLRIVELKIAEAAKDTKKELKSEAEELETKTRTGVKNGLNGIADGLNALENKVRHLLKDQNKKEKPSKKK